MTLISTRWLYIPILPPVLRGQVLIGPHPSQQTVVVGETHTLFCRVNDTASKADVLVYWEDLRDGRPATIFFQEQRITVIEKYSNFNLESPDNMTYNLVIEDIQISDEGTYLCQSNYEGSTPVSITVEGIYICNASVLLFAGGVGIRMVEVLVFLSFGVSMCLCGCNVEVYYMCV